MNFTSVSGHLTERAFPSSYNNWILDEIIELYDASISTNINKNSVNIAKNLEDLGRKSRCLIIWTDCDREGENIGFEIINVVRKINRNINVLRANFSALTKTDIFNAINNLREPNKNLSDAVDVRIEIDLIIGASFTRLQTLSFRDIIYPINERSKKNPPISYGPCQFPTLNFIVERAEERRKFRQELFWFLEVEVNKMIGDINHKVIFNWKWDKIFDLNVMIAIVEKLKEENMAKVIKVNKKQVYKYRPFPLNTVEFSKLASIKLKLNSHKAMEIAEKLYQKGFISYPRTETQKYPQTFDFKKFLEEQTKSEEYGSIVSDLISSSNNYSPRLGKSDDKSHPPIYPVKFHDNKLSQDERKVYDLIAKHFVANLLNNGVGEETKVTLSVSTHKFTKSGLVIKDVGFLNVYTYDKWDSNNIPDFQLNEIIPKLRENNNLNSNFIIYGEEGKTTPPDFLKEAELITLMDKYGIGTDATIHEHIKNIQERLNNYI